MDDYTALHRHLGRPRGLVNDELLDAAVAARLEETDDLDWKKPPQDPQKRKQFIHKDFLEDVAAFANAGGGTIVIGVDEVDSAADHRVDAGEWTDTDVRTLRTVAASKLYPAVQGLRIHRLTATDKRAVIVVVPPSLDRPHFIQNDQQYYAARLRVGSGSRWLSEREIAERYRLRFTEQRDAEQALERLYARACTGVPRDRTWGIAVARPRLPLPAPAGLTASTARALVETARLEAESSTPEAFHHPIASVDDRAIRPGLRRWHAPSRWYPAHVQAQADLFQDGSITLAAALGGHEVAISGYLPEGTFSSWRMETLVVDALCLMKAVGDRTGAVDYEVRVGLAPWNAALEAKMVVSDRDYGVLSNRTVPMDIYEPVDTTVSLDAGPQGLIRQAQALATDCVNQGGVDELFALSKRI
ncbi:ATP-binding protein [Glycomyces sp. NPDC047369]